MPNERGQLDLVNRPALERLRPRAVPGQPDETFRPPDPPQDPSARVHVVFWKDRTGDRQKAMVPAGDGLGAILSYIQESGGRLEGVLRDQARSSVRNTRALDSAALQALREVADRFTA